MIFALKLFLAPILLGLASLAGRIWGNRVAGMLVALPIISGPIVLIITLEQGIEFGTIAANGCLWGIISIILYCLCYGHLARYFNAVICCIVSTLVILFSMILLNSIQLSPWLNYLAVIGSLLFCYCLLPITQMDSDSRPPYWEIGLRMAATAILVITVTSLADQFGPHLSGIASSFPIASLVLVTFTHYFHGANASIRAIKGLLIGLSSFATFFLITSLILEKLGLLPTFTLASLISLTLHTLYLVMTKRVTVTHNA